MSPFNLDDYEPVENRLRAFWKDNPMGRVLTELVHVGEDGYIVKASIWRGFDVIQNANQPGLKPSDMPPGGTGFAAERVTERGVNATSALENCETSAIGRALANLGYAPKGKRPSREEMRQSADIEPPAPTTPTSTGSEPTTAEGMVEAEGGAVFQGEASAPPLTAGSEAVPGDVGVAPGGESASGPASSSEKSDLSFHPNSPHRMVKAPEFPDYLMCAKRPCNYWEYVGKEDA